MTPRIVSYRIVPYSYHRVQGPRRTPPVNHNSIHVILIALPMGQSMASMTTEQFTKQCKLTHEL